VRLGIGVAGCGVEGERDEALAAVNLDFDLVEEIGETAPIPADVDAGAPVRTRPMAGIWKENLQRLARDNRRRFVRIAP
jgi:hypothetical protein